MHFSFISSPFATSWQARCYFMFLLSRYIFFTSFFMDLPAVNAQSAAQSFCSSSDGQYKLSAFDIPVIGNGYPGSRSTWKLSVDDTPSGYKQKILGFGAAVTDSTVTVFNQLSTDSLSSLLRKLLTYDGANFSLFRHTIGSSDLSADPAYTYDDNNGFVDVNLGSFNLGDRGNAMADMLRKMQGINPAMRILGSPWSPPGWMKLNGRLWGTTINNNLNHTYVSQYAQYFVKYLQAFRTRGVTVDAITIQNEPLNSRNGMPTMYIYADEAGQLIQEHIGPALAKAGLSTEIWAYDHNTDQPSYPQMVLNSASQYVQTVAWHCYAPNNDWSVLTAFHDQNPNVQQFMTECYTSQDLSWNQAADFTIGPLQNWARGAIAWVLGTDTNNGPRLSYLDGPCTNCQGLVTVNTAAKTYTLTVDYYMMAQFSKFIPRGATVLSVSGSYSYPDRTGFQSVASLNPDGTKTIVMENLFTNDIYVTVSLKSGTTWSGRVYASSVTTWVVPK
jgi:O-glycosyl hydrolase